MQKFAYYCRNITKNDFAKRLQTKLLLIVTIIHFGLKGIFRDRFCMALIAANKRLRLGREIK